MRCEREPPGVPVEVEWRAWEESDKVEFVAPVLEAVADSIASSRTADLAAFPDPSAPVDKRRGFPPGAPPARFVRRAFVHRYNPNEPRFSQSDPYHFPWGDAARASTECWISSEPGQSTEAVPGSSSWSMVRNLVEDMAPGDLVYMQRTAAGRSAHPYKAGVVTPPRSLIGISVVEDSLVWPDAGWNEWLSDVHLSPLRLFDYPVAVRELAKEDSELAAIGKFRGASVAFDLFQRHEALPIASACGLPYRVYSEPDIDKLASQLRMRPVGDLSSPWGRLRPGLWQARDNTLTAWCAMKVVAEDLAARGFGHVLVHRSYSLGFDIRALRLEPQRWREIHVEVKGTKRHWPAAVKVTPNQRAVASTDPDWRLATVHCAQDTGHEELRWWSYTEVESGEVPNT